MGINIFNTEHFLKEVSNRYPNCTFYYYERAEFLRRYTLVLDFAVGETHRDVEVIIDHRDLVEGSQLFVINETVTKLLAQKETVRLCTKFWTGVEIL